VSPPMRTRHPSRCGVAMLPAQRSTRATCRVRPRRCRLTALKCRRRAGHKRGGGGQDYGPELTSGAPPLEWTRGWFAPVQRPAGRTLLSCRGLRPVKPILQKGRSSGRCPPASSMTARTAPTPTPCRGVGHGGDRRTRH
jgi:hypothetical protein